MPWLFLLCLAAASAGVVLQACAQPDTNGFITIDCGGETPYFDSTTDLSYAADVGFTDSGSIQNIAPEYVTRPMPQNWKTLRSFPTGARNCYTVRSLESGHKYLIRATFKYGNYDSKDTPPTFDLHIGVNFWKKMTISDRGKVYFEEAIIIVPDEFVQVCLVNTGTGTPFITGLGLRPLKNTLYPQANATQGLVLLSRTNFGPASNTEIIRHPDDPHDRIWWPWPVDMADWANISTAMKVEYSDNDLFEVPTAVMQTAIMPRNDSKKIEFSWHTDESQPIDPMSGYLIIMHFSELQPSAVRQYYINLNGKPWWQTAVMPTYLKDSPIYTIESSQYSQYNFSIDATTNSTLPPIINALEVFSIMSTTNVGMDSQDGAIMNKTPIYIVVSVVVIVVIVFGALLFFRLLRQKKQGLINDPVQPANEMTSPTLGGYKDSSLQVENRQFTFKELGMITNNFQRVLGRGGFGYVYHGFLEDGTQVAVKLRSHSSSQGVKEFLAEVQILARIHHKNLVSMIGYCKDGEYMALVYEYMPEGTLQEHIAGKGHNGGCLTWTQRLRIALDSGQGLEYLHKGCNPPVIHRDVKATNILLNARLEAKVADFGVSKAFSCDNVIDVSTNTLVGTPGYVDPEYQATMRPSTKSDVYSFGVVLLELVTGKRAILRDPESIDVIRWARQRLAQGDIEAIVDTRMHGDHDINGVWKATNIALNCTKHASAQRPTMTDVLVQLQECLELEEGRIGIDTSDGFQIGCSGGSVDPNFGYNAFARDQSTYMNQSSATPDHNYKRESTMDLGPAAR